MSADCMTEQLSLDSWLSFLDREVLTYFDDQAQLVWARNHLLDEREHLQLGEWRGSEHGCSRSIATRFLRKCGVSFAEYLTYCRDNHLQPWVGQKLPLDWFAGW